MSEINIKAAVQAGLNQTRNVSSRDDRPSENTQGVTNNITPTDTVSLTTTATQLNSLQAALSEAPVVDQHKVEELRAAIAEGTYSVDAAELAQNMVGFETNLR